MLLKCGDTICKTITIPAPSKWVNTPNVEVEFTIPEGLKIASTTVSHGSVTSTVWTIALILAGESPTLELCFDIDDCDVEPTGKSGTITISTTAVESNEENNVTEYTLDYFTCENINDCVLDGRGIDDVLAVEQAISAPRGIDIGNQTLSIGDVSGTANEGMVIFDEGGGEVVVENMGMSFFAGGNRTMLLNPGGALTFTNTDNFNTSIRAGLVPTEAQTINLPNAAPSEAGQFLRVQSVASLPTGTQLEWWSLPVIAGGVAEVTSSISGLISFPHGMGVTPDVVTLTMAAYVGGAPGRNVSWSPGGTDDTNITGVLYDSVLEDTVPSTSTTISWIAIKNPTP